MQVQLTLLGDGAGAPVRLNAKVGNLSGRGVRLLIDRPLEVNIAVQVDFQYDSDAALLLGEVVYCVAQGEHYAVGLELHHRLVHLTSLRELMKRLMSEQVLGEHEERVGQPVRQPRS